MTARLGALVFPVVALMGCGQRLGDPRDSAQVARGQALYSKHCASCHGAKLEGQPEWKQRRPNGRLPAPPHDASGHTWHHPDLVLFDITKRGASAVVGRGHQSDMPPFAGMMSDEEIWSVLAFIKSSWPPDIQQKQAQVNARSISRR